MEPTELKQGKVNLVVNETPGDELLEQNSIVPTVSHIDGDTAVPVAHFIDLMNNDQKLMYLNAIIGEQTVLISIGIIVVLYIVICSPGGLLAQILTQLGSAFFALACLVFCVLQVKPLPQRKSDQVVFDPGEQVVMVPTSMLHELQRPAIHSRHVLTLVALADIAVFGAFFYFGGLSSSIGFALLALYALKYLNATRRFNSKLESLQKSEKPAVWQF